MSSSQGTAMDVDGPSVTGGSASTLKRSSSAPMINENNVGMATAASPPPTSTAREINSLNIFGPSNPPRTRRFSASFSPHAGSPNTNANLRLTPRISQLRQEECADHNSRELAHEREIHHTMQISQSWEDLTLVAEQPKNKMAPLNISLPPCGFYCNSPSPTRLSSPGFQSPTRSRTFIRRSASPVLRPSPLGAKRKLNDDDRAEYHLSPRAKRAPSYNSSMSDRGGLLTTAGVSSSATTSSPLPGSLSSIGTPESISSADSPGFQFRMVDSPSPSRPIASEPMAISKQDQEMAEGPS